MELEFILQWLQPEYLIAKTYLPAGYLFFPEGLTGTVGMDLRKQFE
jgi:hypothetical protein